MEKPVHPFQEGYESAVGVNIEPDWLGRAVCRTTENASDIFLPGPGEKRRDQYTCESCPVSGSCLNDAMVKSSKPGGGRRAGSTPNDRNRVHDNLKLLLNFYALGGGSTRAGRAEFYSNNPSAPALVRESMDWWDNFYSGGGDVWPTETAVAIAASAS